MNTELVKEEIEKKINSNVKVTVYGLRHKTNVYIGTIYEIYPYIFTVLVDGESKSFSYADIITGEVVLQYL